MNKLTILIRVLYGSLFCVFGLNGFVSLIPVPPMSDQANDFLQALISTGYMMPLWKLVELITGMAIVFNVFVPLALIILSPVLLNIFFFHLYLDQEHLFLPIVLLMIHGLLLFKNRKIFFTLVKFKSEQ